jgi:hypothetical protein
MLKREVYNMSNLREKAHQIIDSLSEQKVETVYEYLQFIKLKEELKATYELTSDKLVMDSIEKGLQEEADGNLIALKDIVDNV